MVSFAVKTHSRPTTSIALGSIIAEVSTTERNDFVKHIPLPVDLLSMQEHWLTGSQLNSLVNIYSRLLCMGLSRIDSSDILYGRPYGG